MECRKFPNVRSTLGLIRADREEYYQAMPGDDLNKKVRGDWFEVREKYDEIYELEEIFTFSLEELSTVVSDLRISVEQGVTEYKQHKLQRLFAYLESLGYDSRGIDELADNARDFGHLLFVVLIQRLLSSGAVPIRVGDQVGKDADEEQPSEMGMKEILEEIQQRLPDTPGLKQHPAVKNIFMQASIYKNEFANMQKLAPNILPEKRESFYANFKQSFGKITEKMREQYRQIQSEDEKVAADEIIPTNPLKKHDLAPLRTLFEDQAQEFAVVRSTLQYAADERYQTRNILSNIVDHRERLELLVAAEHDRYAEMEPGPGGARVTGRAFGAELINVLQRQISRMA